jgi:hypothetical protein
MPRDKWPRVERALRQLGVSKRMVWRVEEARNYLSQMDSLGTPLMPDFTLHNHNHSDNVVLLLARLHDQFRYKLNDHEVYLLATSAYLHDLGMFFSEERFRREILPNPGKALRACPHGVCDRIENYQLEGKRIGAQIRETHNLLSAFMLRTDSIVPGFIEQDDLSYLIAICRGHRKANLREQGCTCYRNEPLAGDVIRVGLLAALLRLGDALDFHSDRAPKATFNHRALDFLKNPIALEHWLRHYFVTDPYIARQDEGGNITLVCQVNFRVPIKELNGESYLSFFRPLFEKHVTELNRKDLDINQYPPTFTEALRITAARAILEEDERDRFRDLPTDVIQSIEASGCEDVLSFLQQCEPEESRLEQPSYSVQSPITYDNPFFHRGAIKDQEYFYGRELETREILRAIKRGQCVSIVGPWHIGKTSLLFHIKSDQVLARHGLASNKFVTVYCTGQELRDDDQSNLYSYLLRKIQPSEAIEHSSDVAVEVSRSKLLDLLRGRFDLEEFRTLCFTLQERVAGLNYDALPGEGFEAKARELIAFLIRRDQLDLLPIELFKQRPDLADEMTNLFITDGRGTSEGSPDLRLDVAYHELDELAKHLTQKGLRIVLLLDEFELFAVNSNTKEGFFRNLQALQAQHALTLVTSSRIPLHELSSHDGSCLPRNFFLMFLPLDLGLLSSKEALALITEPSRRAGITFSERTVEFILDTAGLHPFFLQVACDTVFDRRSMEDHLDDSDYEILIHEIGRQLKDMFGYYWNTLGRAQQSALVHLEAAQADPGYAQCLKELARQGLVVRKGQAYDYVSTSFEAFVQKHHAARLGEGNRSLIGRVLGSVRIDEEIGSGGMATVYKAYQPSLERDVAVKVAPRDVQQEGSLQRFQREARAVARLRHPNILSIYDFGQEEDLAYIVMDFVPGGTLADLIHDGLPLQRAIEITVQIGDALHCAHEQGIVHRDVKPANILIDTDGRPLLSDFGLVKFLTISERITKTGLGVGTAAYVAPEQASGGDADARSDVYALGVALYEMVTGCLPFEAEDGITMVLKKLQESPPSPRQFNQSLPAQLEEVILKAMQLKPEDRYQSALEMTEALRDLQSVIT